MTETEYRIVMTLSDVCTAVSRMNRVLRDTMDSRDHEYIEESLQLAVKAGQPLMDALMERLKQGPLSTPSQPTKEATAATGEAGKGTPEPQDMKRWNWDRVHGEWYVCENNHSKSSGCEWRPATEAEIMAVGREPNEP